MAMTEQKLPDNQIGSEQAEIRKDEELAAMISAYLDGELAGKDLEQFESLLKSDAAVAREVRDLRDIELRLMKMGSDILSEPVPEAMLEALSKIGRS